MDPITKYILDQNSLWMNRSAPIDLEDEEDNEEDKPTAWVKYSKTVEVPIKIKEAEGMEGLPKGWTNKSVRKFSKSLTGKEGTQKDFFERCVNKMKGKVSNPEAFCASVKDELHGSTYWRGKGKTPQQAGKDVKAKQNVKQEIKLETIYKRMLNECAGDETLIPDEIGICKQEGSLIEKINCLLMIRDQHGSPFYQYPIDREIDALTDNYEGSGEI